jgi:hypothetical protein
MLGCDLIDIHVSDADDIIVASLGEFSKVLSSDQPRADHADGDVLHVMYLVCEFWRGLIVPRDWRASRRRVASKAAAIRARV